MTLAALLEDVLAGYRIDSDRAMLLCDADDLDLLTATAATLRDRGHGDLVSYSRKVFIPLTHLCRDVCHYCTFAKAPRALKRRIYRWNRCSRSRAQARPRAARRRLFTLGDQPELRYAAARRALANMGYATTLEYLAAAARAVFAETGLLPHLNPGVMSDADFERLRPVSVSMGLMLETAAERLSSAAARIGDRRTKQPAVRLATLAAAGERRRPLHHRVS
jgi:FO synthase